MLEALLTKAFLRGAATDTSDESAEQAVQILLPSCTNDTFIYARKKIMDQCGYRLTKTGMALLLEEQRS